MKKLIVLAVLCLLSLTWGQRESREKNLYHVRKISIHSAFITCEDGTIPKAAISQDFGTLIISCP